MTPVPNSPVVPEAQDDDDDNISLTSTVHEGDEIGDADKDWVVEDLLAERPHPDDPGQIQYLIRWEGFPLEDCTWEPEENLGPGLLPQWEETKKEIEAKKRQPFDLEEYSAACIAKAERHMRRNGKRKRLGFPLTEPFPEEPSPETPSTPTVEHNKMDSSDEAEEVNEIDPDTSTSKEPRTQKATKQKTPQSIPSKKVRTEPGTTQASKARRPSHGSLPKPSLEALKPVIPSTKISEPSPRAPSGTMTGYQGTARKPSMITTQNATRPVVRKVSGQKQATPISRPSPTTTTAPTRSSSFANKFAGKRLTATRTRPQPAAQAVVSNVFMPSKPRRQRRNLADVMADRTKTPKQFSTMRIRNIANKRATEKNDATANYSSIPASFFLNNDGATPKPKENNLPSNTPTCEPDTDQMKLQDSSTTTTIEASSLTHSPVTISPVDTSNPATIAAPRVKKSVRFTEVLDDNPDNGPLFAEPMDIDHPPTGPIASNVSPTSPRKLSLSTYQERAHTQIVSRTILLGPDGSQELRVLFNGVARHSDPWLSAFMAHEKVHFNTTCASYNFLSHIGNLVIERLSSGVIEPNFKEQAQILGNAAEWLRRSSLGMHIVTPEYSILLYPARCDGWKELDSDVSTLKHDAPLRHLIYRSTIDPKHYPLLPAPSPSTNLDESESEQRLQTLLLVKELTGLDSDKWLPQEPKHKDNQAYMMLFPPDEAQALKMIKHWLQSARPGCRIFSTENPGSWLKFHECVKAGVGGTVIIHSNITPCLRKIRNVWKMVEGNDYTFWDLSTGEFDPPLYPSDPWASIKPGTLQMTRLFPFGRAFLITPSLVLSEPNTLYKFLKWFKTYAANPNYLIMASANFPNYLKEITLEKEREYKELCDLNDRNVDKMLEESGRRKEDIETTFRSWEILQDIIKTHGDEKTSEDVRKVYWITDLIDPNDEQSLVTYFLWWSTTRLDRYRRFYVLGSGSGSGASMAKRAYRNISVPIYTDITVSDPDEAAARQDQRTAATEARETKDGEVSELLTNPGPQSDTGGKKISISQPYFKFPSALFETDRAQELRTWITNNDSLKGASWSRLHANPVSWVDVPMADQFNDAFCTYDTYKNWFYNAPKFNSHINTWYGLFYTIDKVWDPQEPLHTYGRHPWIAIYRPVNPHLIIRGRDCKRMELFIWDIAAMDNEPTRGQSGCLDMQCRLVDLVREETPQRDQDQVLDRVWVGSATDVEVDVGDNLLDVTCNKILEMYNGARRWLPPFDKYLDKMGWKELPRSAWERGMALGAASRKYSQREMLPIPRNASDEGKLERSIWPPQRGRIKDGGHTMCLNDLYEAALKARLEDPSCETMRYQYRATTEWYADQAREHRDAGHVCVDSGKRIMKKIAGVKK